MSDQLSDKLYTVSIDIVQILDALRLIRDSLWSERNAVANDATATTAKYFCERMEQYFSAYDMLFNRLQDIASTIGGIAADPLEGEVSAHG